MATLLKSLSVIFPGKKFHFLLGFKQEKDIASMLSLTIPFAENISLTKFDLEHQGLIFAPEELNNLANILDKEKYQQYQTYTDFAQAYHTALAQTKNILVISGSLYLIANIYQTIFTDHESETVVL
jgi:folylpolyglutamate synthase/dihydropteroate synthase